MKTELVVYRQPKADCVPGSLYVNDKFFCYTLEPVNAIPEGRYKLGWHSSPHLREVVPILLDVPGRSYILIHVGNTVKDTEGCILVGYDRMGDTVLHSRAAFEDLLHRLEGTTGFLTTTGSPLPA